MKFRIATILTILLAFSLSFAALAQQPSGKGHPDGAAPGQRPDGIGGQRADGARRPDRVGGQRPGGQRPDGATPGQRPRG